MLRILSQVHAQHQSLKPVPHVMVGAETEAGVAWVMAGARVVSSTTGGGAMSLTAGAKAARTGVVCSTTVAGAAQVTTGAEAQYSTAGAGALRT